MNRKFKGIIFDLDGTLLDTIEDISDAVNNALVEFGFKPHSIEDYRYFVGDGVEQLVRRALGEGIDKETFEKVFQKVKENYNTHWNIKTKPYKGIEEMLSILDKKNIKMAIISNKPHKFTELTVNYFFGKELFYPVFGASDDYPKKPHPFLGFKVLEIFNLDKEEVAYLGDSDIDVIFARNTGIFPLGAAWGFRGEKELHENGAEIILKEPIDVLNFF